MKIWVDDVRPAPKGYEWIQTVDDAKSLIKRYESITSEYILWLVGGPIELIDLDHDAGDFAQYGGDYIKLLDWLEETGRNYPIINHSMNPIGVQNMRRIIRKNGWKEVV